MCFLTGAMPKLRKRRRPKALTKKKAQTRRKKKKAQTLRKKKKANTVCTISFDDVASCGPAWETTITFLCTRDREALFAMTANITTAEIGADVVVRAQEESKQHFASADKIDALKKACRESCYLRFCQGAGAHLLAHKRGIWRALS